MSSLSILIVAIVIALLIGIALGALATRASNPQQESRQLEARLKDTEEKMLNYQQEVTEHFLQTSQLVNQLTQSYQDVHQHLADSALKLANPEISQRLLEAADGKLPAIDHTHVSSNDEDETEAVPPRDWAPKEPGATGQLSEEFGLDKNKPHSDEEAPKL